MKDINLLQSFQSEKKQFDLGLFRRRALIGLLVLVVLLGGCYGALLYGVSYFNAQTETLKAEAAGYSEVAEVKASISGLQKELESLDSLIKTAEDTSLVNTGLLDTLASVLSENTYFTSLTVGENGTLVLSGVAATREEITNILYNLKKTDSFSDVAANLINTAIGEDSAADTYDFTITAILKGGAAGE